MKKGKRISKRSILYAMAYAALFSTAMIIGGQLEKQGSVQYASARTWGGTGGRLMACWCFYCF
ncbi:MAG: hypothetical protein NC409_03260 [Clostridium sp.]|nr:hypothetical protein [Clostridium sp.]